LRAPWSSLRALALWRYAELRVGAARVTFGHPHHLFRDPIRFEFTRAYRVTNGQFWLDW
jgi:hypothetical protein